MRNFIKRHFIKMLLLACIVIWCMSPVSVFALSKQDGANWACARANEKWEVDVDGYWGCQCVDLIYAYYKYLVGYSVGGNAYEYATNRLPDGWTRVYSAPQIGDVVVWGKGASIGWGEIRYADSENGHVGIITGVNSDGSISTVETNGKLGMAAHYYQRNKEHVACYIRPNWSDDYVNLGQSFDRIILLTDGWKPLHVSGNNVELRTEAAKADYHWHFERQNDGSYVITSLYNGKALEIAATGIANGTNVGVYQAPYASSQAQKWFIQGTAGAYEFVPLMNKGMRLDASGGYSTDGTNIQIYTANGTAGQKFSLYDLQGTGPTKLSLNMTSQTWNVGTSGQVSVNNYYGATAYKTINWSSSNPAVASVTKSSNDTSSATVTALAGGTTVITATSAYNDAVKASFTLTVHVSDSEAVVIKNARIVSQYGSNLIIDYKVVDKSGATADLRGIYGNVYTGGRVDQTDKGWGQGLGHCQQGLLQISSPVKQADGTYRVTYDLSKSNLAGDYHELYAVAYDTQGNQSAQYPVKFTYAASPTLTLKVGEQQSLNTYLKKNIAAVGTGNRTNLFAFKKFEYFDEGVVSVTKDDASEDYIVKGESKGTGLIVFSDNVYGTFVSCKIVVEGQSSSEPITNPSNTSKPTQAAQPTTAPAPQPTQNNQSSTVKTTVTTMSLPVQIRQSTKLQNLVKGDKIVSCVSSNKKILTVSQSGVLKARKNGTAVVTMRLASGKIVKVIAKVQKKAVATSKIQNVPKNVSLKKKRKLKLQPVLAPITSRDKITYKSSNTRVATVSGKGVITAKKAGKATITVQAGKKKVKITVKVR